MAYRNGPNYRVAFIADDVSLMLVNNSVQGATTVRITERGMGQRRPNYLVLHLET